MLNTFLHAMTDLGDSAVTCTCAIASAVVFVIYKQRRAALAVTVAFFSTAALITFGKISLYSQCGEIPDTFFDLKSPSGHSALSIAVYGTLTIIVASSLRGNRRVVPYLLAIPLLTLIVVSRVVLGAHSVIDVLVGSTIGLIAWFGVWRIFLKGTVVHCPWLPFSVISLIVLGVLYGTHFPAEALIDRASHYIRVHIRSCSGLIIRVRGLSDCKCPQCEQCRLRPNNHRTELQSVPKKYGLNFQDDARCPRECKSIH